MQARVHGEVALGLYMGRAREHVRGAHAKEAAARPAWTPEQQLGCWARTGSIGPGSWAKWRWVGPMGSAQIGKG
jgi:hypothetical protein